MALVTVEKEPGTSAVAEALERGDIVFFPAMPWAFPAEDQEFLRSIQQTGSAHHKNIAYRPGSDKVTGFDIKGDSSDVEKLRGVMSNFSRSTLNFLKTLLPRYLENCRVDYASFRPLEEEGRDLSMKKRNDLLHIDAFPTRPTGGDLILRTFVNIHPSRPRVWLTSEPFEPLARRYAIDAGWTRSDPFQFLRRLFTQRSAYDEFMLHFHDYLKANSEYQKTCPKLRSEFPPGSVWMCFTDIVPHAVLSGQYALEQTIMVSRGSLQSPERAPIEILQRLSNTRAA